MADAPADPRVGEVLEGRYRILERLASGGMGVVYRGERVHLGRAVAVKFLDAAAAADDNSRARFEREAKAMSRLSHPHVVSVIDFGLTRSGEADTPYIVMDYVTGKPLISVIAKTRLKAHRVVHIMKQVMAGLAHAHNQDVIHRDIKPANIMLTEATGTGDFVRLLDFGLAKLRGASSLSSANVVIGTPSYMSPEQGSGKPIDGRTDIYSSGVILYELLMGEKPFVGEDAFATLRMHQSEPVPRLGDIRGTDELKAELNVVIQKSMAKKPNDRYQTALEMGKELARIEEAHRPRREGARGKTRRDPARATTELPTASAAATLRKHHALDNPEERTSVIPSSSTSPEEPASLVGGFFRLVFIVAAIVGIGGIGWYYWQQREAAHEEPSPSPNPTIGTKPVEHDAAMPLIEFVDASAVVDASMIDAATVLDAGVPATDAGTMAGVADAIIEAVDAGIQLEDAGVGTSGDAGAASTLMLPKVVNRYDDVKVLLAAGRRDSARAGLRKLIRSDPKNGFYHLKLGNLEFERGAWSNGLVSYRHAVRYKRKYRSYATINRNAIRALGSSKTRWAAHSLITRSLGRAAVPYLKRAVARDKSSLIRKRAAAALKKIR